MPMLLQLFFVAPTGAQQLYYLHPDVSFFKGNGFKTIGPCEHPALRRSVPAQCRFHASHAHGADESLADDAIWQTLTCPTTPRLAT
jgi:hypothetical protein